jgi:hypothetical protein
MTGSLLRASSSRTSGAAERADVVAGCAGMRGPDKDEGHEEFEGSAGDAASPGCTVDPAGDLGLAFQDEGNGADEVAVAGDHAT